MGADLQRRRGGIPLAGVHTGRDVVLTNCKIVQGPNIADHAMALLLALTRGLNGFFGDKQIGKWNREGVVRQYCVRKQLVA